MCRVMSLIMLPEAKFVEPERTVHMTPENASDERHPPADRTRSVPISGVRRVLVLSPSYWTRVCVNSHNDFGRHAASTMDMAFNLMKVQR